MRSVTPELAKLAKLVFSSPSAFLGFGFGSGLSPFAPGTMGTLVAVPFVFVLKSQGAMGFWISLSLLFLLGIGVCTHLSRKLGVHDHAAIVWDEMVGYWLAVAFVPLQWHWLLAGFILFRFFDILKPWPICQIDKNVGGGLGIMLDDIVAAGFTLILLDAAQRFL